MGTGSASAGAGGTSEDEEEETVKARVSEREKKRVALEGGESKAFEGDEGTEGCFRGVRADRGEVNVGRTLLFVTAVSPFEVAKEKAAGMTGSGA